jgi:hypothetical protein
MKIKNLDRCNTIQQVMFHDELSKFINDINSHEDFKARFPKYILTIGKIISLSNQQIAYLVVKIDSGINDIQSGAVGCIILNSNRDVYNTLEPEIRYSRTLFSQKGFKSYKKYMSKYCSENISKLLPKVDKNISGEQFLTWI